MKDTGIGIDEKNMNRILDLFFTTEEASQGMGLGLSISHSIIEEHNGFIEVKSKPESSCSSP